MQYGDPRFRTITWRRIVPEPMSGCWLWTGATEAHGYGVIKRNKHTYKLHRVMLEAHLGRTLRPEEVTDHLCRVRCCVNPDHLEPVSHKENMRRGIKGNFTTNCPSGHPYDDANTYRPPGFPDRRYCRACNVRNVRRYQTRKGLRHVAPRSEAQ